MKRDVVRHALVESASHGRASSELANRALDILVATLALILFAPIMALAALAVLLEGGGPILFRHVRIGRFGEPFAVLKLRTMCVNGDRVLEEFFEKAPEARDEWAATHKLKNDPRVSRLGRFLRKSSLDELPQLYNVLLGEMSIVGPRPIIAAEVEKYGHFFAAYCSVRPGITGVWQVSGRNDISYQRRVEMDALYSRRKSVVLDLSLMFATVPAVIFRRGSY